MRSKHVVLVIFALMTVALFTTNVKAAEKTWTGWAVITRVAVGSGSTYIWTAAENPCGRAIVNLSTDLPDYDKILSAVLTAMSLRIKIRFYVGPNDSNYCMVSRIEMGE
jgi:hypothetical protein